MATKLCIVTDAWLPQINGVVTTLTNLVRLAEHDGWQVLVIHPNLFRSASVVGYPEIKLSWPSGIKRMIQNFGPDHLHIATEGPLGLAARISYRRQSYTTAYHTQWAEFLYDIFKIPKCITWQSVRWFHDHGKVMVPTPSIKQELIDKGVKSEVLLFSRGVDISRLKSNISHTHNKKPRLLSVGRVSLEKNLDVFCNLDYEKYDLVLVGDGPYLSELKKKYPWVEFKGMLTGSNLADEYIKADCMVFTSKKDTFGLVIIESQSQGTPVAAYPVKGPIDVILPETGVMHNDIERAIEATLLLNRDTCKKVAMSVYSWDRAWQDFKNNLVIHCNQ